MDSEQKFAVKFWLQWKTCYPKVAMQLPDLLPLHDLILTGAEADRLANNGLGELTREKISHVKVLLGDPALFVDNLIKWNR